MIQFQEWRIPAEHVHSLCWRGDTLVDWLLRGSTYALDGTHVQTFRHCAYRFDAATMSPSGAFAAVYERAGTKALLLDHAGETVRELNRSYYQAHVYEYPIALFQLPDGREVLAHCPDAYNRIEIEDAATGERLTASDSREPQDMFYSRLAVDPSGRYLLSAGWVWTPWDTIRVYAIDAVLRDPRLLDAPGLEPRTAAEISGALFADADTLISATSEETFADEDDPEEERQQDPLAYIDPYGLAVYDLQQQVLRSLVRCAEPIGTAMWLGPRHIVSFYQHPKLIDITSGDIIQRWEALPTGAQTSSILRDLPIPPLALDPANRRFAVAVEREIVVIQLAPTI